MKLKKSKRRLWKGNNQLFIWFLKGASGLNSNFNRNVLGLFQIELIQPRNIRVCFAHQKSPQHPTTVLLVDFSRFLVDFVSGQQFYVAATVANMPKTFPTTSRNSPQLPATSQNNPKTWCCGDVGNMLRVCKEPITKLFPGANSSPN